MRNLLDNKSIVTQKVNVDVSCNLSNINYENINSENPRVILNNSSISCTGKINAPMTLMWLK